MIFNFFNTYLLCLYIVTYLVLCNILIQFYFPEINYFLRAFFSVVTGLSISFVFNLESLTSLNKLIIFGSKNIRNFGVIMLISLIIIHIIFH